MREDNYTFQWSDLGDIELGRPELGNTTYVSIYRMLQFSVRSAIALEYGGKAAQKIFYNAGLMAGMEFCINNLDTNLDACQFFIHLADKLKEFNIGLLEVEKTDLGNLHFIVTVSEDLDCSGLPDSKETVCGFDEGFISGILREYMGIDFLVKEIDCWSNGNKLCRFEIKKK
ncbi:V4R domain-containing protein [Parabacteroides sp. FAFU027]|uniref:V4R domain-containing protein n=1 Tax=Parabacteroides sp. FAFU027 TaxID=2922715 RepID=UPI001FAE8E78|nr:V4R domain-containing protein [Parabacteroides sp. FAFU027]